MGVVQKKFSRRHKHKLSAEEKLERDLKDCMKCKYFWGNNNRCINNKCYRERKKLRLRNRRVNAMYVLITKAVDIVSLV